jgi:predicted N-acyltransferase
VIFDYEIQSNRYRYSRKRTNSNVHEDDVQVRALASCHKSHAMLENVHLYTRINSKRHWRRPTMMRSYFEYVEVERVEVSSMKRESFSTATHPVEICYCLSLVARRSLSNSVSPMLGRGV